MFLDIVSEITNFINDIKTIFIDTFNFLPSQLLTVFSIVIILAIGGYIYRLVK